MMDFVTSLACADGAARQHVRPPSGSVLGMQRGGRECDEANEAVVVGDRDGRVRARRRVTWRFR